MKTRISINQVIKKGAVGFMSLLAILAIAFPLGGAAYAEGAAPTIRISTSNNYLQADDFTPNATVTFTVYASQDSSDVVLEISRGTDNTGHAFIDGWEHSADLVVGNYVVATDGINEKQLILEPLTIEVFNPATDFVAGTATPGRSVWVVVGNDAIGYPAAMWAEADAGGIWKADFASVYDFTEDMWGSAVVSDEDWDVTVYHRGPTPTPWLIAFPENDAVEGWEWPEGATVYLTINNAPEGFIREGTAEVNPWGDQRTYIRFDFAGEDGYDLQVGDMVTLTDAFGTSTTHEVQPLSITGVDRDTNIVTGTANNDAFLQVWVHGQSEPPVQPTIIDGIWQADLSDVFDVTYGTGGRAWVIAEGGNATAVDWYVPNPHFTVFPEWEFFDGLEWPDGSLVSISVEGKDECSLVRESWGGFFNGNFGEGCNIEVGNVVTFTDGETIRTHTVRNLAITKVNQEDDTVTGTSDARAEVYVWPHATGEQQMVIASPKGKWNMSFAGVYDLKPGDEGRAQVLDEMGNATAVDWRLLKPRIVASITEDWFNVQEFSPNTALNFTIYEAQGEKSIWKGTVTTDDYGFAWIDAEGRWDLEPGNYLVVKDGSNSKDLVIEGFTFDVFNLSNGQLIGTAPEPYGRNVWVGIGIENDGWSLDVTTDGTGVWIADFGQPVPGDYQWVAAQIFDEDGDASELRPAVVIDWALAIANQPDWVNSGISVSSGQSFTVEALGLMNPCSDSYPNGSEICIFYTPLGAEWVVPYENEFGIFPGPGLSFMALLGRIGDGDPFYVGAGGTFTAEQDGTLWFTPNDNLRTDNQGAYSVRVLLEP